MKITTITILISAISCLAIVLTLANVKRETMGFRSALIWIVMWAGIGFFSLFPPLLNTAMHIAQMENRMYFILIISVFILFALVFNLSSRMDRMQRSLAKIVQEIAIINNKIEKTGNIDQEGSQ